MNDLFQLLVCPACGDDLALTDFGGGEGLLRSGCGLWFPVEAGIPRIFVGEMRRVYATDFGPFLARHGLDAGAGTPRELSRETRAKLQTRESFGYEWTHFHEMLPEWRENARWYFEPIGGLSALGGKLVLEGGCGKGRHTYYALEAGAKVVAVDFSRAIDVARANCERLPGERLFVQADLMDLPFRPGTFDAVYSLGVLHHLPDPEAGFRALVARVRPGGRVLLYVYHAPEGAPIRQALLAAVTRARRVTTRLPHRVLLPLTTALGYGLYATVVLPYKALSRIDSLRPIVARLPLGTYARYPARVIVNDQFDRFSAPIEHRYRRDEVLGWFERAGLSSPTILGGAGWRAVGERPAVSS